MNTLPKKIKSGTRKSGQLDTLNQIVQVKPNPKNASRTVDDKEKRAGKHCS